MNNAQMLAALAALPDPDYMHATTLDAPLGTGTSYNARTVVLLLEQQRRQMAGKVASASAPPSLQADSAARFDAFRAALDDLCTRHGIQISTSQYDGLQAWPLRAGETPVYSNGFENCIPDGPNAESTGPRRAAGP